MIQLDDRHARRFLEDEALSTLQPRLREAHQAVLDRSGTGSEMLGWRELLLDPNDALLEDIESTATEIRRRADVLLCIGIGGSYLGARAVIEALTPYFSSEETKVAPQEDLPHAQQAAFENEHLKTDVLFAGHHMSGAYLRDLLDYLEGKSVYVNVISKSGTTLEPALAFRFVRRWLEEQFEDADRRIIVTTDPSEGALNQLRAERGYKKYEIPRDVGGRFSVLTPVGLLPIATAGIDIRSLFYGAKSACEQLTEADDNQALRYAGLRYLLLQAGYAVEVLATFEPRLGGIGSWWQQLFGESEGKEGTGLYPATVQYSTDLHSLGQYMQEGQRIMAETFLMAKRDGGDLSVPEDADNLDQLNYLAGKTYTEINQRAHEGTAQAHAEGGVPNMTLWLDRIAPASLGEALYFFEHAVAAGGYLLEVNPFNQPGVEAYKRAMFELLGRPS